MLPKNEHKMNIWQGEFPHENLNSDGYESTAPVGKTPNIFNKKFYFLNTNYTHKSG